MPDIRPSPAPTAESSPPPGRRCPRCRVALEHERTYIARGLSGVPSFEHRYVCPACDGRYKWSSRDQKWKEVYT